MVTEKTSYEPRIIDTVMYVLCEQCDSNNLNFCSVRNTSRIRGLIGVGTSKIHLSNAYSSGFLIPPNGSCYDTARKYNIIIDKSVEIHHWFNNNAINLLKVQPRKSQIAFAKRNNLAYDGLTYSYCKVKIKFFYMGSYLFTTPDKGKTVFKNKMIPVFCIVNIENLEMDRSYPQVLWK